MAKTKAQQQQATGKRASIYIRVSSEGQALEESVSLDEQTRDIEAYAAKRGYTIIQRYQDVESGVSRTRPGFRQMQAAARQGRFDIIIAWKSDRLARGGAAMGDLLDSVGQRVGVETVRETFNLQTAELMAAIAKMERQNFVERSLMGKRGAARAGRIPAGRPLYGYTKDAEGKPVTAEHEAVVVSRLFHEYANERQGVPTIAKTLEREYGFKRTAAGLYWMLRNATYAGRMVYDGVGIPCPAIVDRATWDRAQDLLTKKTVRAARGNTKATYTLQGIVSCEGCGRILGARTRRETNGRTLRYYRCRGYTRSCRPRPYIRADELEKEAWYHVRDVLAAPDKVVKRFSDPNGDTLNEDIRAAERDLQKWTRRNERLTQVYVQEVISQDEFEHQRRFVMEPLEAVEERLGRLRVQKERASAAVDMMAAFSASVGKYLERIGVDAKTGEPSEDGGPLDAEGRKAIIRDVVASAVLLVSSCSVVRRERSRSSRSRLRHSRSSM